MKLLIAGDFAPRHRVAKDIKNDNFYCLDEIIPYTQLADYAILNLESPVVIGEAKSIDKSGPNLCCDEKAIACIKRAGFHCVTLANNHFRDYGNKGVNDTLISCANYGLDYVGGGNNISEASKVLFKDIKGKKMAVVNICENEWSIANDNNGGSAPLNLVQNYYSIQEAKKKTDYVLVIVHGGIEGYQYPTPRMQETYRFFIDAGADAVINHHQHCFSGYEVYKQKPIFYGLGNFCFDINNPKDILWAEGYMVQLNIEDDSTGFDLIPYNQCVNSPKVEIMRGEEEKGFEEKIIEINRIISSEKDLEKRFNAHVDSIKEGRLLEFEPFGNKYIRALQARKMLPSFVSKKTKKDVFNVINCESHREVILNIFNKLLF